MLAKLYNATHAPLLMIDTGQLTLKGRLKPEAGPNSKNFSFHLVSSYSPLSDIPQPSFHKPLATVQLCARLGEWVG